MNLLVWLPAMFLLGFGTIVLCFSFIDACDKI
jgi:hypothetical protein